MEGKKAQEVVEELDLDEQIQHPKPKNKMLKSTTEPTLKEIDDHIIASTERFDTIHYCTNAGDASELIDMVIFARR